MERVLEGVAEWKKEVENVANFMLILSKNEHELSFALDNKHKHKNKKESGKLNKSVNMTNRSEKSHSDFSAAYSFINKSHLENHKRK